MNSLGLESSKGNSSLSKDLWDDLIIDNEKEISKKYFKEILIMIMSSKQSKIVNLSRLHRKNDLKKSEHLYRKFSTRLKIAKLSKHHNNSSSLEKLYTNTFSPSINPIPNHMLNMIRSKMFNISSLKNNLSTSELLYMHQSIYDEYFA